MYDSLTGVIRVEAEGPVRIVRLARPAQRNAVNEELHRGLTRLFPLLSADRDARVAVITGEGRAFSAGGDFDLLDRMAKDRALRHDTIAEGREIVLNMIRCRVPIIAAVNGPAVGLGCSVIALSDVVYMAESAYLSDPHVAVGLSRPTAARSPGPSTRACSSRRSTRSSATGSPPRERARSASRTTCAPTTRS
jgi:enoyl-CoA hydratase/carnithine racemase